MVDVINHKLEEVLKKPNVCPDGNPIPTKDGKVIMDIRPAIYDLVYSDENINNPDRGLITMTLGIGTGGYARPNEVLVASGLVDAIGVLALRIHRKALFKEDTDGIRRDPMEF